MSSKRPLKPLAELLIVSLGALVVAGVIQDIVFLQRPELITTEKVLLKYYGVFVGTVLYLLVIWKRKQAPSA